MRGVAAILFDEFHERHLYGDITLARALQLQEAGRPDLKLVVMSATLESDRLAKYLAPCPVLTSSGRAASGRDRIPDEASPGGELSDLGPGRG